MSVRVLVLVSLVSGCGPTLDLQPLPNSMIASISELTAIASRDGAESVGLVRTLRDGNSICPFVTPIGDGTRISGGCQTALGSKVDGYVDVVLLLHGTSTYRFAGFTVTDAAEVSVLDGLAWIDTEVRSELRTSRTRDQMRVELTSTCRAGSCEVDGTIDVEGEGFANVWGDIHGSTGMLEVHGASDSEDDDNILYISFEPGCVTWSLTSNDWFGSVRRGSSC
jgi:hypothetical protein